MNDLSTWLRSAIARSSASAWASLAAGGNCIGVVRAIERGTMASISACRDAVPMVDSMCC